MLVGALNSPAFYRGLFIIFPILIVLDGYELWQKNTTVKMRSYVQSGFELVGD